jgi:phospholipid transport system substrate-binding protein
MADALTVARRSLLGLAITGLATPALAQSVAADPAQRPIRDFYAALEMEMKAGRSVPFRKRFNALAPVIDRVFDVERILRVSVGPRWSSLAPASRATLMQTFRNFTVASYVASFDRYDDEKFEILMDIRPAGTDKVVPTRIVAANGEATRLDYLMHPDNKGWRVTDVLLEGTISRVAVQRSDFRGLVVAGDASALIASLQQKIADLSGGSLNS